MADVIFARPVHNYESYFDLYRLIELAGYPLIHFGDIDPQSDNTYIMTIVNGENENGWHEPRARIILYDLEWRLDNYPHIPGVSELWAADRWYAQHIGARYVPLGSDARLPLADLAPVEKTYDAAHMMYVYGRRDALVSRMRDEDGIRFAPNGWGMARHEALCRSRLMLHIHQLDGAKTVAPQRFALAAAYKLPLLSEEVSDAGIFDNSPVVWAGYDNLRRVLRSTRNAAWLETCGEALFDLLCVRHSFGEEIGRAL